MTSSTQKSVVALIIVILLAAVVVLLYQNLSAPEVNDSVVPTSTVDNSDIPSTTPDNNQDNGTNQHEMISVITPQPGDRVSSPLTVQGQARGTWFFEGSFPVVLANWDGLIIAEGIATSTEPWMTEEFIPFSVTLEFDPNQLYDRAALILQKSNPSGLPEHDDALEFQVYLDSESQLTK